ncbi:unnamed protein product [Rotaria sordida]|uniref:Uncharacterized protein n=1 Tax=Rotaria sordida TaxID=392033 RepID=A0A814PRJ1_9BILA|nr:unnamed protein product [Rotaria sordida]CAF4239571.1 unnamed protein product [Rotaria sordida]
MHLSYQLVIDDRSETLSFESEFNTICSTLSSNDALLLIANETVCRSNRYEFYTCPSTDRQFNLFTLKFILHSFHDKITFVKWTSDFLVLTVISTDMTTKIFSVSLLDKLYRFILVSHVCETVDTFFEQDSLNIMTICKNAKVNYWTADMDLASIESISYIPDENVN